MFKIPWEFFVSGRNYDVVVSTQSELLITNARLVIILHERYITGQGKF